MDEQQNKAQQDRIRRLVELNGRLDDIDKEFSKLHNEFLESDEQGLFFAETNRQIQRLKGKMFVDYIAADNSINSH